MSTTPAKRVTRSRAAATKITDEMNVPPKRGAGPKLATTRRAKADVEELKMPEDTIASAAPKRPSKPTLTAAPTTVSTRRRIKVTPLVVPAQSEDKPAADDVIEKSTTKKSKTSAKENKVPTKNIPTTEDQPQLDDVAIAPKPKTRRKVAADTAKMNEKQPATKSRGRPKKNKPLESVEEAHEQQPVRQTRTRAGSGATATQATAASAAKATEATRKKVTFQDLPESDKENQPLPTKKLVSKGQSATAASGLRAKPVRKLGTTKGKKTAGTASKSASDEPKHTPLSPKKVTQVAKSSSPGSSDEDELSGAKTPLRDLSQSPKRNAVLAGRLSPVKKLDSGPSPLSKSPEKGIPTTTLMSPARKLPASPFKDALKESPKRGEGALIFPSSALKATTTTIMSAPAFQSQSALLHSPKRGPIDSSIFTQSAIKPFKLPAKPTLMQSPPKRLFPFPNAPGSEATPATVTNPPRFDGSQDINIEEDDVVASSSFRSSQSPERSLKVHKISNEELALAAAADVDFDQSILDVRSPVKVSKATLSALQSADEEVESLPIFSAELSRRRLTLDLSRSSPDQSEAGSNAVGGGEPMEDVKCSLASEEKESDPATLLAAGRKDTPSFLFHSARFHDDEESSEDELQGDVTPFRSASTFTPGISEKAARPRLSTVNPAETSINAGFTPLAAQFSGWLASSPDKPSRKDAQTRGLFSPLAAQHVPGKVQINRQSTPKRRSVASRYSTATIDSVDRQRTASDRKSYESIKTGTPDKCSYFADEMVVKDLENEVEAMEAAGEVDAYSQERDGDTESPAIVREEVPAAVPDFEFSDFCDVAAAEEVSDHVQTEGMVNLKTTIAADDSIPAPANVEGEVEGALMATTMEEPVLEADAELSRASENPEPSDHEAEDQDRETNIQVTTSNGSYATPTHRSTPLSRFANTVVSKVPLRPEGYMSPLKVSKKRSRSLSAGPSSAKKPIFAPPLIPRSNTATSLSPERRARSPVSDTPEQQTFVIDDFGDSTLDGIDIDEDDENLPPATPSAVIRTALKAPTRSPLKAVKDGALKGAVVFVDVYTTEGADASGIFVELLTQMGARCVRQWNWNPRASVTGGEIETENVTPSGSLGRVGITHVVYKDGGKRTLEKVRDAGGVVRCVGVGWVLDCERENAWLEEAPYAVDISLLPRGGSRRRKSMEPRALVNMNGSITAAKGRRSVSAEMTPAMKAELVATPIRAERSPSQTSENGAVSDAGDESAFESVDSSFSTPTGIQAAFAASTSSNPNAAALATPTGQVNYDPSNDMSPTTPYSLSQGAKLVQQTCPPKQTHQGLFDTDAGSGQGHGRAGALGFPVSGRIEDQPDASVRVRLEAARRKTMNWRPRVASPLGR